MNRLFILAAVLASSATALAQGLEQKFTLELASANAFRGTVLTDGLVFNPLFDFSVGTGTHLTAWGSFDIEDVGTDEWRFSVFQNFDAVAFSGAVGATRYQRDVLYPDTTEVFARATMMWPIGVTFSVHRDVDAIEGTYARASMGAGIPKIGIGGAHASLDWRAWLGYSDGDHAAAYYGDSDGGFADLGFRATANFGVVMGEISVWAQAATLVDPDYTSFNGDRSNVTYGVSFSMRF